MTDLNELEEWRKGQAIEFKKRIDKTMPEHGVYYCEHGEYIGYKGIFADKCIPCTGTPLLEEQNKERPKVL